MKKAYFKILEKNLSVFSTNVGLKVGFLKLESDTSDVLINGHVGEKKWMVMDSGQIVVR